MRLALYQPDIPQNTGTLLRLAACLNVAVDIIEPAGFDISDRNLKRAALDYLPHVALTRHQSWEAFENFRKSKSERLLAVTSRGSTLYTEFAFHPDDVLLLGRESAGLPDHVRAVADGLLKIPMKSELRSLNVAVAGAMVLGEALRQTGAFAALV